MCSCLCCCCCDGVKECLFAPFFLAGCNILLYCLIGVAFIGAGAYVIEELSDYEDVSSDSFKGVPIAFICLGVGMALTGALGMWGVIMQVKTCMTLYIIISVILLLGEIVLGIYAYVETAEFKGMVSEEMRETALEYGPDGSEVVTRAWDRVQRHIGCCGVDGNDTWVALDPHYPDGCCREYAEDCGQDQYINRENTTLFYQEGCVDTVHDEIKDNIEIVWACTAGFCVLQIAMLSFSVYIMRNYF